jgi:hypothetical protein
MFGAPFLIDPKNPTISAIPRNHPVCCLLSARSFLISSRMGQLATAAAFSSISCFVLKTQELESEKQ